MAKKYSFMQFLREKIELIQSSSGSVKNSYIDKITIPMIQRDYAQGRKSHISDDINITGKKFIEEIFSVLDNENEKSMDLDFIYGSIEKYKEKSEEKNNFLPLDGQQRLTTLFLLYWYIGSVELDDKQQRKELYKYLKKFSYATRTSSERFCDQLTNEDTFDKLILHLKTGKNIRDGVLNLSWFHKSYLQDPTITAMLNMLQKIQNLYSAKNNDKLYDSLNSLCFYVLPLNNFKLTKELYIKMNARGKLLTDFENFKADLQHWIKDHANKSIGEKVYDGFPMPYDMVFINKLDNDWTTEFWKISQKKDENKTADSFLMRLFYRFLLSLFIINSDTANKGTDQGVEFKRIEREEPYSDFKLFSSLLSGSNIQENKSNIQVFEQIMDNLCNNYENIQTAMQPVWYKPDEQFSFVNESIEIKERIILHAIFLYLVKENFNLDNFRKWMRVCWNIVQNSDIDGWTPAFGAIELINQLSVHSENIYTALASDNLKNNSNFAKVQINEEIKKAKLIIQDKTWEKKFLEAESHPFFTGSIDFIIPDNPTIDSFEHNFSIAKTVFDEKGVAKKYQEEGHIFLRALISRYETFNDIISRKNFTDKKEKENYLKKKLASDDVVKATVKEWFALKNEEALYSKLKEEVSKPSPLKDIYEKKMHERLYKDEDLQNWMQENGRIRVQETSVSRPRSWYDWVCLKGFANDIAVNLIRDWGCERNNEILCKLNNEKRIDYIYFPSNAIIWRQEKIASKVYWIKAVIDIEKVTLTIVDTYENIIGRIKPIEMEHYKELKKEVPDLNSFIKRINSEIETLKAGVNE